MIGAYQPGDKIRISLEIVLDGQPVAVNNPRVQSLILPDRTFSTLFPQSMSRIKDGTYIYEFTTNIVGNYTAILQAEYNNTTIEQIETIIVGKLSFHPQIVPAKK